MIIKKSQAHEYIRPGVILRRSFRMNTGGWYIQNIKVTSNIYTTEHGLEKFDIERIPNKVTLVGGGVHIYKNESYFVSDLFNGKVEIINKSYRLEDELFEI